MKNEGDGGRLVTKPEVSRVGDESLPLLPSSPPCNGHHHYQQK